MKIGIDIGGSHIGIGVVDENGRIIDKVETFIKDKSDIEEKIEKYLVENVTKMLQKYSINQIGIAVPGTVSDTKIIKAVNLGIEDYDLGKILEEKLKNEGYTVKVKLKNDGKCAGLAEQKYGELQGYDNSVFLCIGTGVGSAVIFNGKLLEPKGVPGFEFSHTIIQKNGLECNCGKRGCFEVYASLKRFKERVKKEFNLESLDGECIRDFIRKNPENVTLKYMINNYIEDLSIGISNIINIFEPEAISIGGSMSHYDSLILNRLREKLNNGEYLFNKDNPPKILTAQAGNDAGIIGATLI